MKTIAHSFLTLACMWMTSSCSEECFLEPCEEAGRAQHTDAIDRGITGVIAYKSDSCTNGCCECSFETTQLTIFEVSEPVTSVAQVQAQLGGATPTLTVDANERYSQSLDVGRYVVCARQFERCANIEITQSGVLTLNVHLFFGPTRIVVFDADGTERPELVLE
jgi:hypothetical protein